MSDRKQIRYYYNSFEEWEQAKNQLRELVPLPEVLAAWAG
jgi:hypothetical protein